MNAFMENYMLVATWFLTIELLLIAGLIVVMAFTSRDEPEETWADGDAAHYGRDPKGKV